MTAPVDAAVHFLIPTKRAGYCPCGAMINSAGAERAECLRGHHARRVDDVLLWEAAASPQAPAAVGPAPLARDTWPDPPGAAAFAGLAGRVVDAIDPHSEADRVALLANFFAAFGSAIGTGPHQVVGATLHRARENWIFVGKSAKARKGDSWPPIAALFRVADPDWLTQRVQGGLSSGEGLIWAVRDAIERQEPVKEKGRVIRYERVIADEGVSDKRCLVFEPETARVLKVMGRQGNTLSPVIREAWDSGDLRVMTKTAAAAATGAHISIVGHITLEELRHELEDTEAVNGFANRFLWLAVKRSKKIAEPVPFGGKAVEFLGAEIATALNTARRIGRMERDPEARALWAEMYDDLSNDREGLAGSILARAEAHVLRLSLLYALADGSLVVRASHLLSAAELWAFADRSVEHIFGDATGDSVADTISRALASNGEMSRWQITDLLGRHVSSARIEQALQKLLTTGKANTTKRETGGRPAEVWLPGNTLSSLSSLSSQ